MIYSPVLIVHMSAGVVGVLAGFTALMAPKGERLHRRAGDVFVLSMLGMATAGAVAAFTRSEYLNVVAGAFTFYLVATAGMTVMRKEHETGRAELFLLLLGSVVAAGSLILGWQAAHGSTVARAGGPSAGYVAFGSMTLLFATGDVRMLIRGGVSGAQRIVRHLGRMCFALIIAAGSFFLGTAGDPVLKRVGLRATLFTPAVRQTHLPVVPVLLVVALAVYWLIRVQFTREYRKPRVVR